MTGFSLLLNECFPIVSDKVIFLDQDAKLQFLTACVRAKSIDDHEPSKMSAKVGERLKVRGVWGMFQMGGVN